MDGLSVKIVSDGVIFVCVALVLGIGLGNFPEQDSVCLCPLQVRTATDSITLSPADEELTAARHNRVAQVVRQTLDGATDSGTREFWVFSEQRAADGSRLPAVHSSECATGRLAASADVWRCSSESAAPFKSSHEGSRSPFAMADKLTSGTPAPPLSTGAASPDPRGLFQPAPPLSTRAASLDPRRLFQPALSRPCSILEVRSRILGRFVPRRQKYRNPRPAWNAPWLKIC